MRTAIYRGDIAEVEDASGLLVHIRAGDITNCVAKDSIILVPDEAFQAVKPEYDVVKAEISGIVTRLRNLDEGYDRKKDEYRDNTERLWKLREEYQRKKEALREMLVEARRKEISIVSRLIKESLKEREINNKQEGRRENGSVEMSSLLEEDV
jgi:hypothetical protein